ncbi:Na(+)-translocating NADH-quinone reductase subunit A [Schleiferia thermophila]|jgi:Na+-transporting NADH:ubiquinone oxidoreductase subunit A|uniref:Na(+)-translocating NADH-quinone reductase subunit A n=1 Tax=Schleiferia thermophila TaxID=884107 RepID=A0A369A3D5_9FLAO|nr:Na(+)-translocating NADH-quinone reductase subunit A [Schleiferia thermophila]KFD38907.1 Na(+)-translocating NADH-quinone reductase subunit A [Schleiferia thermophila str. Yellowstone]RCX03715.1 Na+-transporting NADH:ubiquinone oxidoreductase subunit A [Schleiferia thermophila]GCD79949.1 Na(+)-translocating NADH-quinone reductase subunit A [Schleiferia thermophila]
MNIRVKRGADINIAGAPEKAVLGKISSAVVAIKPDDFKFLYSKLSVREGDRVKVGSPVIFSKDDTRIVIPSPVSGEVVEVKRGEKRKILAIKIKADNNLEFENFGVADPKNLSRQEIIDKLLASGLWSLIRQRPYGCIANPDDMPKSIFISCVDTAPISADPLFIVKDKKNFLKVGLDAIKKLTDGKVHVTFSATEPNPDLFSGIIGDNVETHTVSGPHPAGNVGVHIHHIDPINKGEKVWYLYPQDLAQIGELFQTGQYNPKKIVALTGPMVKNPGYYETIAGASLSGLKEHLKGEDVRIISGNILTGVKQDEDGYLGFYDYTVSVLEENHEPEFLGWLLPGIGKFTIHRVLLNWFQNGKALPYNTKMNGEERAFVMTGEYEKVFPFDIYPVQLLKSIMVNDIDKMEQLGLYEVIEEDFALCEVVCTSKIPVQETVYKGLELLKKEVG